MSTVGELFAPQFLAGTELNPEVEQRMAQALGANSLRYLSLPAISRSLELPGTALCQACLDGHYPTPAGERLYQLALQNQPTEGRRRTYDAPARAARSTS
jgi:amidophosphoribosyltransferase